MNDRVRRKIIKHYYGVEGGYVNDESDLGGETGSGGITRGKLEEHKRLWAKYNFTGDMRAVPYELYEEVMTIDFWNKIWGDKISLISESLADTMYGWGINSGPSRPIEILQKHLCVMNNRQTKYGDTSIDGGMGPHTYGTLLDYIDAYHNKNAIRKLIGTINAAQHMHYINVSLSRSDELNERFTDGWLNRIMDKVERLS